MAKQQTQTQVTTIMKVEPGTTVAECSQVDVIAEIIARCNVKGARPFSMITHTKPDLYLGRRRNGTGDNPWWAEHKADRIRKLAHVHGLLIADWDYGASVERQQVKEGQVADYQPKKPVWQWHRLPDTPFGWRALVDPADGRKIVGPATLYLYYKLQGSTWSRYLLDGTEMPEEAQLLLPDFEDEKKGSGQYQGLENGVEFRTLRMENLREINFDRMVLRIRT